MLVYKQPWNYRHYWFPAIPEDLLPSDEDDQREFLFELCREVGRDGALSAAMLGTLAGHEAAR